MGIKGLTTFVRNKSELCMDSYELHDTNVVIDGDAVLCQLYLNHTIPRNGCFGGDYDKYGNTIYKFFHMLFQCKITPYIILDGGYESRKMDRILERFKGRIDQVENLNSRTQSRNDTTPLLMREAFEDIVLKLGIKLIRCDFEGDRETANIAKSLKCPVISNDSDFYIFDVPYIPFPTVRMTVRTGSSLNPDTKQTVSYRYIPCQVYRIDKFLQCTGGLSKDKLPLLAALVGNDFVDGIDVTKLGIRVANKHFLIRIEAIIDWLISETKETALSKVLDLYEGKEREEMIKKLDDAMNGYDFKESKYLKYLIDNYDESTKSDFNMDQYNSYEKLVETFPKLFIDNFRKSLYPTRFMDILTQNKYYNFKPQVEVMDDEHAHTISNDIMAAIHKILTGSSENLVCLIRLKNEVSEDALPLCDMDLPTFNEIQTMDIEDRRRVILKILNINERFVMKSLTCFPDNWYLLILTLKYMIDKFVIPWPVVYSILFCKLVIDVIDPKIGFFRSGESFNKQFHNKIKEITANRKQIIANTKTLKSSLDSITFEDTLIGMSRVILYFEFDRRLKKNVGLYDRKLMHSLSQFQSCLLHIKSLNQLLNMPYHDFFITECFNGTFVYNFTCSLRKRDELDGYVTYLFHRAPLVLNSFEIIIKLIKGIDNDEDKHTVNSK
ncbi:protein asteroid-like [Diorhabda sublineata]|uniref:protein asteroid-like n=1 Tax=Diorhabda sublineata TaxID=1163346 RepID=UPI0024E1442A|nr:protein asteroid-like [Diorhabda sublineata]